MLKWVFYEHWSNKYLYWIVSGDEFSFIRIVLWCSSGDTLIRNNNNIIVIYCGRSRHARESQRERAREKNIFKCLVVRLLYCRCVTLFRRSGSRYYYNRFNDGLSILYNIVTDVYNNFIRLCTEYDTIILLMRYNNIVAFTRPSTDGD